jgi:hypothetical protein
MTHPVSSVRDIKQGGHKQPSDTAEQRVGGEATFGQLFGMWPEREREVTARKAGWMMWYAVGRANKIRGGSDGGAHLVTRAARSLGVTLRTLAFSHSILICMRAAEAAVW